MVFWLAITPYRLIPQLPEVFPIHLSADGKLYEAALLHVKDGEDIGCGRNPPLELHVPVIGNHYSVSGTVAGELPAREGDRFEVVLEDAFNTGPYGPQTRHFDLADDRRFHFEDIPQGRYRIDLYDGLYGRKPQSPASFVNVGVYVEILKHRLASQLITVSDRNMGDLVLSAVTLPSVSGIVTIKAPPASWKDVKPSDLSLQLVPHSKNGSIEATVKDRADGQGEFVIGAADPGEYELRIVNSRSKALQNLLYIQSAHLEGKEVDPRFVTLPQGGNIDLQVVLGSGSERSTHSYPETRLPLHPLCR